MLSDRRGGAFRYIRLYNQTKKGGIIDAKAKRHHFRGRQLRALWDRGWISHSLLGNSRGMVDLVRIVLASDHRVLAYPGTS